MAMSSLLSRRVLGAAALLLASCSSDSKRTWTYENKSGRTALLINGKAVPPANIPHEALRAVAAGNQLDGKPYRMGGGHKSFEDRAYDCSGTVSYLLHHAGCLDEPTTSDALRKFGKKGEGEWITVYARRGHVFLSVAGLRFDTGYTDGSHGPQWTTRSRPANGAAVRHPAGL